MYKKTKEYNLTLYLRNAPLVEIVNYEGMIKFDAKVVEFYRNNDILVMHYLVEGQEKKIEIIY